MMRRCVMSRARLQLLEEEDEDEDEEEEERKNGINDTIDHR